MNALIENKTALLNTLKILIYKEDPQLLEHVNLDDDSIFNESLLMAYFNNKTAHQKQELAAILSNKYVPASDTIQVGDFTLLKQIPELLKPYFIEYYKGETVNEHPSFSPKWEDGIDDLATALGIIQTHLPQFYQQLLFANKWVYLHDNPKILNFTSYETLGMLYFYVLGKNNVVYFIEELIHQGSHNYFYYVLYHPKRFFKIDSLGTIMKELTGKEWDYRSLYGAFHGLYTVTQRLEYFDLLLEKNALNGREKHELLGRLTDQFGRFRTGLELLDQDAVFTEAGQQLYAELDHKGAAIINKYKTLEPVFDLSHRDLDFRYDEFCVDNPFETYMELEKQGAFSF